MITNWLTLRDLEYVIAVAKHEHFGHAARECNVSQPSLSTQIKKIEGYLNTVLFERTNRSVRITEAGKNVVTQAAIVLDEARKIPLLLKQTASNNTKVFKLGVISSLAPLVPAVLIDLKKNFPNSGVTLHEATTDVLISQLKLGALEAVILADTIKDPALNKAQLFFEPFYLAAPKEHAILKHHRPKLSDLKVSEMVLLDEGHCLRDQTIEFCPANRRGHPREFHATSLETLLHLVASGAGYTLLPALAAKESALKNLVAYRKFDDHRVGRKIIVCCRAQSESSALFDHLSKSLKQ